MDVLHGKLADVGRITGGLASVQTMTGRLNTPEIISPPIYDGPTIITPTQTRQELNTAGYMLDGNITVEPIPQNYGLITYNGGIITVS